MRLVCRTSSIPVENGYYRYDRAVLEHSLTVGRLYTVYGIGTINGVRVVAVCDDDYESNFSPFPMFIELEFFRPSAESLGFVPSLVLHESDHISTFLLSGACFTGPTFYDSLTDGDEPERDAWLAFKAEVDAAIGPA